MEELLKRLTKRRKVRILMKAVEVVRCFRGIEERFRGVREGIPYQALKELRESIENATGCEFMAPEDIA